MKDVGRGTGKSRSAGAKAYRRLTAAEKEERDLVLQMPLIYSARGKPRVDEILDRSHAMRAEGYDVAAVELLKYVDLLLARFNWR